MVTSFASLKCACRVGWGDVVECRTRNRVSPDSNPPLLPFRRFGHFRIVVPVDLAIDSGGHVSDLVLARNCCLTRMLPGEAELVSE